MIFNSTDINMILKEIGKVQDFLSKIKEMKQGMLGSAIIQIENEVLEISHSTTFDPGFSKITFEPKNRR